MLCKNARLAFACLMLVAYSSMLALPVHAQAAWRSLDAGKDADNLEKFLAHRPLVNRTLTMGQAVAIALQESPVVREAQEEFLASVGRLRAARAETRAMVSANAFASGGSNSNIVSSPSAVQPQMIMGLPRDAYFDQNLMVMFPLYTGGRLGAMVRQAKAMRNASRADLQTQQQDIALMTRVSYRDVLARRAILRVSLDRMDASQERLRVDQERLAAGAVPALTTLRDEAEVAGVQQEITNARRDADLALIQFKTILGVHPGSHIELGDGNAFRPSAEFLAELTAEVATPPTKAPSVSNGTLSADLFALLKLAGHRRPELQAASQRTHGALADAAVARSAYKPQVDLFAMGDLTSHRGVSGFAGTTIGVVATLPLYDGGERKAHVSSAEAEHRKQEQEEQRIELQVAQEVGTALLNLRAAEQNYETAGKAQAAANEGYRVGLERYQAGRSLLVEVQDALAARTQARNNMVLALFQYNVAQDQLLHAVGSVEAAQPEQMAPR